MLALHIVMALPTWYPVKWTMEVRARIENHIQMECHTKERTPHATWTLKDRLPPFLLEICTASCKTWRIVDSMRLHLGMCLWHISDLLNLILSLNTSRHNALLFMPFMTTVSLSSRHKSVTSLLGQTLTWGERIWSNPLIKLFCVSCANNFLVC